MSDLVLMRRVAEELSGDVVYKHKSKPKVKPPRRRPAVQNVSQRSDYMQKAVRKWREDNGPAKMPENLKELRRRQRQRLKKKLLGQAT